MSKFLMLSFAAFASLLISKNAHAHSDYWRCAVAAGHPDRVQQLCGSRDRFDRTGRVGGEWGRGPRHDDRGGWDRGGWGRGPRHDRGGWDRGGWGRGGWDRGGWGRGPRGRGR